MAVGDRTFVGTPYAPLGQVVAGGLATATFLTLFVLPFLYALLDDLRSASWRALTFAWPASAKSSEVGFSAEEASGEA
jgi:hypothetical protein